MSTSHVEGTDQPGTPTDDHDGAGSHTQPRTMSTTEAAALLRCSRQNVQDLYQRGQVTGPSRTTGTPVRLYTSSVEAYSARRKRAPIGDAHPAEDDRDAPTPGGATAPSTVDHRLDLLEVLVTSLIDIETARATNSNNLLALQAEIAEADKQALAARQASLAAEQARLDAEVAKARRDRTLQTLIAEAIDSHNPTIELLQQIAGSLTATRGHAEAPTPVVANRPPPRPTPANG